MRETLSFELGTKEVGEKYSEGVKRDVEALQSEMFRKTADVPRGTWRPCVVKWE
jgi:hypothetical protein